MGLDPPEIEEKGSDVFVIWPENWNVVLLFLKVQTQWRTGGSGVIGLDYGVVLDIIDRLHPSGDSMAMLDDLQIMEFRATELINEKTRQD